MDKKEFFEPEVKVVELDDRQINCTSNVENEENYEAD